MDEYSRIIIEEYCMNHPKTKKADFLWEMVHMSYDVACEPEPWQLMHHSRERARGISMDEYSRIIIEEYCMNHPKTKKADFLWEMVHMSYDVACEPEPWQLMHLSQLISRERNPELREALEDLDEFMNGY